MTDFTPGAIITRDCPLWDGDRPSWLRDDAKYQHNFCNAPWSIWEESPHCISDGPCSRGWEHITAIRLDASDIVYQCIEWNEAHPDEPVMWPWYGGDEAPADYAVYGAVLYKNGSFWRKPLIEEVTWTGAIGYQRRPTTSLPEPAEGIHTSGYAETIEESPEDFARAACKRAGMVAVKRMTRGQVATWWLQQPKEYRTVVRALEDLGVVKPDPSPLDLAKAAHPNISPEIVESIFKMGEGAK